MDCNCLKSYCQADCSVKERFFKLVGTYSSNLDTIFIKRNSKTSCLIEDILVGCINCIFQTKNGNNKNDRRQNGA